MPLISVACLADSALRAPGPQPVPPYITQAALTTVVATHQLPAAINTLAMCVRPLLLSGWGTSDEPAPQVRGCGCVPHEGVCACLCANVRAFSRQLRWELERLT
jgi:hypothetical protein